MSDKYTFIRGEEGNYSVRNMCRWAKVSRAGYYEWRDRPESATAVWRRQMGDLIEVVFADSDGTYGYRRVAVVVARLGPTPATTSPPPRTATAICSAATYLPAAGGCGLDGRLRGAAVQCWAARPHCLGGYLGPDGLHSL